MLIVVPGRVADGVGKEGGTLLVPGAVLVHAFVVLWRPVVAQLADASAIVADGVALEAALNVGVAVVVGDHIGLRSVAGVRRRRHIELTRAHTGRAMLRHENRKDKQRKEKATTRREDSVIGTISCCCWC